MVLLVLAVVVIGFACRAGVLLVLELWRQSYL